MGYPEFKEDCNYLYLELNLIIECNNYNLYIGNRNMVMISLNDDDKRILLSYNSKSFEYFKNILEELMR